MYRTSRRYRYRIGASATISTYLTYRYRITCVVKKVSLQAQEAKTKAAAPTKIRVPDEIQVID